ncbi:MAG: oligosaccharide repeat unit polymerase [Elusimicrobia bacterium]|jgi:hypothetical protein|nr:oligosaccharide repeat unit polymerase [Elusimicrobiota bacterium]
MDKLVIYTLLIINFSIFYLYLLKAKDKNFWLLPFTLFNLSYLINYPLKAFFLINNWVDKELIEVIIPYDINDITKALIYSTIFYGLFNISSIYFLHNLKKIDWRNIFKLHRNRFKVFTLILLVFISLSFVWKFVFFSKFYGFANEAKFNYLDIFISNLQPLKYLLIFLLLSFYRLNFKRKYLVLSIIMSFVIAFDSLISTSKAPIFILFMLYIIYLNIYSLKVKKIWLLLFSLIVIGNIYYSYAIRYYGKIHGEITFENVKNNFSVAIDSFDGINERIISSFYNRIELLDNLIYLQKRYGNFDKSYFTLGSFVEILNIIPRALWSNKPNLELCYFMVEIIQNKQMKNVSAGVGRIGESFLILGNIGFISGIINSFIMFFIYYKTLYIHKSPFLILFYVNLIFTYFISDNYIFQSFANLVLMSLFIFVLIKLIPNKKIRVI